MVPSQMPASKHYKELLAGPLEGLARFTSPDAQGPAELRLHSSRLLRLLLERIHQVRISRLTCSSQGSLGYMPGNHTVSTLDLTDAEQLTRIDYNCVLLTS